jgi:hypothetical protein
MILLAKGKAEINEEKKQMQAECEKRRNKDIKALEEESKLIIRIKYFPKSYNIFQQI